MKKLLLLGIALLAAYIGARAVKRNAEAIQLICGLIGMTALSTSLANTPKTRSVEDRLNALIPQVFPNTGGTVNGSVNVTGNHTVGGTLSVTSSSTSEYTGGIHSAGTVEADGGVTASSVSSTGTATSEYSGGIHSAGVVEADGGISTTTVTATGTGTSEFSGGIHSAGVIQADAELIVSGQRIAPGQGQPAGYPAVGSPSTAGLATYCNAIVGALIASGIVV